MPTPRPEISVTAVAVVKPGTNTSCQTMVSSSFSDIGSACFCAARRTFSRESPAPSSRTPIRSLSDSRQADTSICPAGGLPSLARRAGSSMPWSQAFRTNCTSGSTRRCNKARSMVVSPPTTFRTNCFCIRLDNWCNKGGIRENSIEAGALRSPSSPEASRSACSCESARATDRFGLCPDTCPWDRLCRCCWLSRVSGCAGRSDEAAPRPTPGAGAASVPDTVKASRSTRLASKSINSRSLQTVRTNKIRSPSSRSEMATNSPSPVNSANRSVTVAHTNSASANRATIRNSRSSRSATVPRVQLRNRSSKSCAADATRSPAATSC